MQNMAKINKNGKKNSKNDLIKQKTLFFYLSLFYQISVKQSLKGSSLSTPIKARILNCEKVKKAHWQPCIPPWNGPCGPNTKKLFINFSKICALLVNWNKSVILYLRIYLKACFAGLNIKDWHKLAKIQFKKSWNYCKLFLRIGILLLWSA